MHDRKLVEKILNMVRYFVCWPPLIVIAFVTMPLTLLFRWDGFWLLFIANEEGCSLKRAKVFLKRDPKYIVTYGSSRPNFGTDCDVNCDSCTNFSTNRLSSSGEDFYNYQTNPAYSHLSYNIFYNIHSSND